MFAPYCDGHGSRVLLGYDHIESVANVGDGMEVRWRCDQGHRGTWRTDRRSAPRSRPPTLSAAA